MNKDKRRGPRPHCTVTALVQQSMEIVPFEARLINLSVEGCLISFADAHQMPLYSYAELTFQVNQLPFRVRGQVRSIRSGNTIGFHFPALSMWVRHQLEDLVEELIEDRLKQASAFAGSARARVVVGS